MKSDERATAEVVLNIGTLRFRFSDAQGADLVKTGFAVFPSDGDESVLWSSDDEADALLAAGR